MKKSAFIIACFSLLFFCSGCSDSEDKSLAEMIQRDSLMTKVDSMAREVVRRGFNAGDGYGEVWIRDYNTFIELAMEVMPDSLIQDNLLTFFRLQGVDGNIPDGFVDISKVGEGNSYYSRKSSSEPRYAAHKNTVETDQESSLIQAVWRYVRKSGNEDFLNVQVDGKTVSERMGLALDYLMSNRFSSQYGLLWGATTVDWGDVQPEHPWGVELDDDSHLCLDIYDNAFFVMALEDFIDLTEDEGEIKLWTTVKDNLKSNIRKHLWDGRNNKFIPHIYLDESPFPEEFDENAIFYHGGTAMAIEAGLLSRKEISKSNYAMLANVKACGATSIGLTVYPPYPEGYFQNKGMYPYGYQNGGDWTWFGARMISQLILNGFVKEAYEEARPMFERVVKNDGFYEWYSVDGIPSGSGSFRGEAGVLHKAIQEFRTWAENK